MLTTNVLLLIFLLAISVCKGCVKYDFENDFSTQFGFAETCENLKAARWYRGLYSWGIPASPNNQSRSYISPTAGRMSCTSSFPFQIQAGGLLEVNVHLQPTNDRDQISVMVYRKEASGSDQLVSSVISNRLNANFKLGRNTLNITFPETTETFEGYVIVLGSAATHSGVLVDSFRYIPPSTHESNCVIYDKKTTAASIAKRSASEISIPTSTSLTRESPGIELDHTCKTYEFGENFKTDFVNTNCAFLSSWELITNIPHDMEKFHSESNSYISASNILPSCTTSYTFPMRSDGYLEVNSYMGADDDVLQVTVYEETSDGLIKIIKQEDFRGSNNTQHWKTLEIPLYSEDQEENPTTTFTGYITIIGNSASDSPILVDSFRFYAPEKENECQIYEESTTCKTYTFGPNFDADFPNFGCGFFAKWTLVDEIPHDVVKFNTRSTSYIQADGILPSCTTSYNFPMRTDGYLEVNSYMEASEDMIQVTVYESGNDGLFKVINDVGYNGSTHKSWNELRIPLTSDSYHSGNVFTGYITIIGSATSQSKVLVDSFRYYAPEAETECQIYQESTTCKIYQFGERFGTDFDRTGCLFLPDWRLINNRYILADEAFPSCTTSYNFRMRTNGYLELNAQINNGGIIYVTVYENLNDGLFRVIKEKEFKHPVNSWTTLRVSLNPAGEDGDEDSEDNDGDLNNKEIVHTTFMGYITIVGSRVSVRSFRYFAPEVEEQCQMPTVVTGSTDASQPNLLSIMHQVRSQPLRSSYQPVYVEYIDNYN